MNNENYVNHYVDIMAETLKEQVLHNISLKANARVTDEVIGSLQKTIEEINVVNKNLADELVGLKEQQSNSENQKINNLNQTVDSLNAELVQLRNMKTEFENVKHQVQHVDTFRNELNKERELHQQTRIDYEHTIKELNDKIDYLQLTPAKRKKIDEAKITIASSEPTVLKDGGSF